MRVSNFVEIPGTTCNVQQFEHCDVTGIAGNDSKRRLAAGGEYYSSI